MRLRAVFFVICSTSAWIAQAEQKPSINYLPAITAARDNLIDLLRKESVEGASIAVTDEHGLLWLDGFGYADKKNSKYAQGDTVYGVGAISMLVTALAVLREVDNHRLRLDEPVAHYVPEFAPQQRGVTTGKPITLRHLLSHHTGLPYGIYKGMWARSSTPLAQTMTLINNEYTAYRPETLMTFAMTNYVVAGRVLEKIDQSEFPLLAQRLVLQPLRMQNSGFAVTPDMQMKLAQGYKNGKAQPLWLARDAPAMGMFSSAKDLAALLQMVLNRGHVQGEATWSGEAINELLRPQFPHIALNLDAQYGLGWSLGDNELNGAGRVVWRQGATLTHRARVVLMPDLGIGIVVLANSAKAYKFTEKTATDIARRFAEVKLGKPLPVAPLPLPLSTPAMTLQARSGAYATRVGYVGMTADNGRLIGDVMGWKFQLQPRADGWFYPRLRLFGMLPIDLELLEAMKLTWQRVGEQELIVSQYKGQNAVFAQRLPTQTLSPAWAARVGRYVIDNPDEITEFMEVTGGELRYDQGVFYLAYKLPLWIPVTMRIPLQIVNDHEAVIAGLGTGLGETVRVLATAQGERLLYSGYSIRRVR